MLNYDDESYTYSSNPLIIWKDAQFKITIWYAGPPNDFYGKPDSDRHKFDCQLEDSGEIIFNRSDTWFSVPKWRYFDEPEEIVRIALDLFTVAPDDTDQEHFDDYTPKQIEWLNSWNKIDLEARKDYFSSEFYTGYDAELDGERE